MKNDKYKRIDIIVDGNNNIKKRAFVSYENDKLAITYKKRTITSDAELRKMFDYETIVVGDPDIVEQLQKQGFTARTWEFYKVPLNVTIPKDLRATIGHEAQASCTTVTAVVEKILAQHYNS